MSAMRELSIPTERCPRCGVVSVRTEARRLGSERCPPPWRERVPAMFAPLAALVAEVRFRPGWSFHLLTYGSETMLGVELETLDTYADPPRPALIGHKFPVPPVEARRGWWRSWLLERIADVDSHEACEWFLELHDGEWVRPFDPHHDPGQGAYRVIDRLGDASTR